MAFCSSIFCLSVTYFLSFHKIQGDGRSHFLSGNIYELSLDRTVLIAEKTLKTFQIQGIAQAKTQRYKTAGIVLLLYLYNGMLPTNSFWYPKVQSLYSVLFQGAPWQSGRYQYPVVVYPLQQLMSHLLSTPQWLKIQIPPSGIFNSSRGLYFIMFP